MPQSENPSANRIPSGSLPQTGAGIEIKTAVETKPVKTTSPENDPTEAKLKTESKSAGEAKPIVNVTSAETRLAVATGKPADEFKTVVPVAVTFATPEEAEKLNIVAITYVTKHAKWGGVCGQGNDSYLQRHDEYIFTHLYCCQF